MCSVDAPDPVVQTVKKPTFVRNDYLDALSEDQRKIGAMRAGRSQLVVAKPGDVGFSGRNAIGSQAGVGFSTGTTVGANVSGGGSAPGDRVRGIGNPDNPADGITETGGGTGTNRRKKKKRRRGGGGARGG